MIFGYLIVAVLTVIAAYGLGWARGRVSRGLEL
jgi:hypothetical protein